MTGLKRVKGKNVLIFFWTSNENTLIEIRKVLMRNDVNFEWHETDKYGFDSDKGEDR